MNYNIIIASTNKGKIKEIHKTFKVLKNINIKSLNDYVIKEPEEPYNNFIDNAIHKAKYYSNYTNEITFSEDSGLCIEALNDFPGVYSKNFIDESGGLQDAFSKLEKMLMNLNNYKASIISACALYIPREKILIKHEAKIEGIVSFPPRGKEGFGFDPIFIPGGYNETFAELGVDIKSKISHRSMALKNILTKLQNVLLIW